MRGALVLCAVLSVAGCDCFDARFNEYCADTGKCDVGHPGGGTGGNGGGFIGPTGGGSGGGNEIFTRTLNVIAESGPAGECLHGLLWLDGGGQATVDLDGSDAGPIAFWEDSTCTTSATSRFIVSGAPQAYSYQPHAFGWLTLTATSTSPGLAIVQAPPLLATATLAPLNDVVIAPVTECSSGSGDLGVIAIDVKGDAVAPAAKTFVTFTSGSVRFDADAGLTCEALTQTVVFGPPDMGASVKVRATAMPGGTSDVVLATGDPDAGLELPAVFTVYSACYPAGQRCDDVMDCCTGTCDTDAGTCL